MVPLLRWRTRRTAGDYLHVARSRNELWARAKRRLRFEYLGVRCICQIFQMHVVEKHADTMFSDYFQPSLGAQIAYLFEGTRTDSP